LVLLLRRSLAVALALMAHSPALAWAEEAQPAAATADLMGGAGAAAALSLDDQYILGPGDELELRLFGAPEFSGPLTVLRDGTVSLPLIGSVRFAGLTLQQAMLWSTQLFAKELLRPDLQLVLREARPLQISMIGQVERPGLYTMSSSGGGSGGAAAGVAGAGDGLPTLIAAIQNAGGITQQANLRDVILQRRLPGEGLRYKMTRLNLYALLFDGDQRQNPFLFDGDIIRIALAEETPKEAVELASVNLSPPSIRVNVIGEVKSPGVTNLDANTPLMQAVLMAGGMVEGRANRGNIELVRLNRNGSVTLRHYRLDLDAAASNERNPPLRDGDIVRVKRNLIARGGDAINTVSQPLTGLVTLWSLVRLVNDSN
jgi:polysaccharide export outer membrane protein